MTRFANMNRVSPHSPEGQTNRIIEYMRQGHAITQLEALDLFGCFRLASRIYDIKMRGIEVNKVMVYREEGSRFARYWMPPSVHHAPRVTKGP